MGGDEEYGGARRRFDVADAAPLLLDPQGVVTGWSTAARRLLGYTAPEAVGRKLAELLTAEDAERVPDLVERCRGDGGWTGVLTVRRKDGAAVRVVARIASAEDAHGGSRWMALLSELAGAPGSHMSRAVLERMLGNAPVGIAIVDTDLRFVWSNTALEQFGGGPAPRRLGLRFADVQPGLDAQAVEAQMRHVLATGEAVSGYEHVGQVRSAPLRETAHMLSFMRLDDDRGRPIGVSYTVVDVTELHRARQRLALLDRAGENIGRSLDLMRTAQELADVAVPGLADFVTVDLLETVLGGAEPAPGPLADSEPVALRRAGHRAAEGDLPEAVVGVGEVATYLADSPPIRCLATGRSWREERLDPRTRTWARNAPGDPRTTFLELGLHSVMIVPVRARGTTLGVTTFFRRRRLEPFDEEDLRLAEDVVSRAAVCVDNARRYARERDAALVLQRSLLPLRLPEQDAVEVAACYRPADELTGLGGDWYDLIPLSGARVALVVGEVPGHGIDAAAAMGQLRTAVRTLAALDLPPEEVLAHLDDLVGHSAREAGVEPGASGNAGAQSMGSGCLYVVYDPVDGGCSMAAAGHPAPAVVLPDGSVTFVDLPQGPPLGVGGPPFEAVELSLAQGSTLALHTDGLLARGETWAVDAGRERLRRALEQGGPLDDHCRTVVDALVPARPHDDVALLMARTRRLDSGQVAVWELPPDPAVVADARRAATRRLSGWGLEELSFTTELVVSELITNAIRYATGPIRLRLIRERALVCEVFDGGATAPHLRHPRATDEGGRGLLLVSQLAQRWGTRFVPDGKIIWAEQPLTGFAPPAPAAFAGESLSDLLE
ncbi:magnesium or manganese-dependent protein phosphatase [Streptomyces viridochromogenes DSM 40736]|uniref:protein-serine/threonine phosphatase n=1 Tax=Streptomyces viridochromogenes (strain DSM 40736 / JCM 4977 / BCRC 1201 / Tue 494) TaxID=591159 RepID=D9XFA4_STRVT|nr:SpoIIE family protein phosphatase [Streptomyces viridochromogenes]EFL30583.1 magnesium or manganese-dependent protein phosphatase [Streptomyces viridochromogenes DSM 40736]